MPESRRPASIRELLAEFGSRLGLRDAVATGGLWAKWEEIVGPRIAEHAQPTSLRQGVLRVRVSSPTWATELTYFAPEIVRRANASAGAEIVREVKVWSGPGPMTGGAEKRARKTPVEPVPHGGADRSGRASEDPKEAFEAARRAWLAKRSRGSREAR